MTPRGRRDSTLALIGSTTVFLCLKRTRTRALCRQLKRLRRAIRSDPIGLHSDQCHDIALMSLHHLGWKPTTYHASNPISYSSWDDRHVISCLGSVLVVLANIVVDASC